MLDVPPTTVTVNCAWPRFTNTSSALPRLGPATPPSTRAITDGIFTGATAEGIDDLLIGQDGVGVLDVRVFESLPDGTVVDWTVKGFAGDPATTPPLEAWLDPDLVPDADVALHGAAWFQTMDPSHAYVHRAARTVAAARPRRLPWTRP